MTDQPVAGSGEPNTELEGDLDVQWVAAVRTPDGHPTPAAGDTTTPNPDWIDVPDPGFGDAEDPDDDDDLGDPIDD